MSMDLGKFMTSFSGGEQIASLSAGVAPLIRVDLDVRIVIHTKTVRRAVDKRNKVFLKRGAKMLRKEARRPLRRNMRRRRAGRLAPGARPRGRSGNLGRSIRIKIRKTVAVVGATWPKGAHGPFLRYGTRKASAHPFMEPALEAVQPRLAVMWQNSI